MSMPPSEREKKEERTIITGLFWILVGLMLGLGMQSIYQWEITVFPPQNPSFYLLLGILLIGFAIILFAMLVSYRLTGRMFDFASRSKTLE